MKTLKKAFAVLLCAVFVTLCFTGCSSAKGETDTIDDKTMVVAYTAEKSKFLYKDKNGNLTGFDVELFKAIFNDVKGDKKTYKFVQVDEGYKVGEDVAYTDKEGNEYIADVMIGGVEKDNGAFNKEYSFTSDIIDNRVIAVTLGKVKDYSSLAGKNAGVLSDVANAALTNNSAIRSQLKSTNSYTDINAALGDLKSGKTDVLFIDEFDFNVLKDKDSYTVLDGELSKTGYVFAFKKYSDLKETFNRAIYELKSPDYNDKDEMTPIVEKFFGYNASSFDFVPSDKK